MRILLAVHRWLGIGIGWLIATWCASGVVMLYAGYPSLTPGEHYAGLAPLDLGDCCRTGGLEALGEGLPVEGFRVQMWLGAPRLTLALPWGHAYLDLASGELLDALPPAAPRAAAERYARNAGLDGELRALGPIEQDQWTLSAEYDEHRPLVRYALDDPASTQLYVSSTSGEVVLRTSRAERVWGWLGPVVHWIYPQRLRQHAALWTDVIIATSLAGTFLTAVGLYIGVERFGRRHGRRSPYRGATLWHHYAGLVFGLATLGWLASGLLSVNPWGLLEGSGAGAERARIAGTTRAGEIAHALASLEGRRPPAGTVALASAALDGKLYYLAYDAAGRARRLDATLAPAPLGPDALHAAALRLAAGAPIADEARLEHGDAYFFGDSAGRPLPAYRVVLGNSDRTRYYLDAASGELVAKFDRARRGYRWLFEGLHRLDFAASLRRRPLWDILMLALLAGAAASSFTGTYMGLRRLLRGRRIKRTRS